MKRALSDVSFTVQPGEIVGLLGGNGAGKTTLVKILSGIVHPTDGECRIHGYVPWKGETEFKKIISLVMGQKSQLWWDLPAEDCFLLLKDIYGIPTAEYKATLSYLAETLKVQSKLNFQVRRPEGHISDALTYLGDHYHIKDLSVAEADIGTTLENMISEGEAHGDKMDLHHI